MRVFVTGATGFIGSAVVRELLDAGHQVVGLARSDTGAAALTAAGAEVHRGDLDDPDSLAEGAAAADGVAHLAFIHDFSDFAASCAADLRAVEAIGAALEGSGKPFVLSMGTAGLEQGRVGTEEDTVPPESFGALRAWSEHTAMALAERGVRSSSVRFAPSVHGRGDHGFVPQLISIARAKGFSAHVGDGSNRWPAVHRSDAARLVRLAVEAAPAGSRLHAVGDEGIPFRDIAAVIGRHLDLPVTGISPGEASTHFGWLGHVTALDVPASNALTRKWLSWEPTGPGLIEDLEEGHYFNS
ncbi:MULTISPECIES: SDR family oxidoreductase [unclassified Streptomyces]|uniref:SDR family oxidoreductase n=1 Tax=unclassified Streptomyces TaxID=2593676 RepID=UPI002365FCB5|nr:MULTISPECIES: SDR family oxidoreductase [unclassified Streptomyces]MDF3143688.1 SDR family oxidoreductase [Streptomyces sp. T21Q-yed]WDF38146.1 SDR family oxidoreductase [Streptomyces sp. T12]